ncbi:unnamed protein product [Urochloa humidicola]
MVARAGTGAAAGILADMDAVDMADMVADMDAVDMVAVADTPVEAWDHIPVAAAAACSMRGTHRATAAYTPAAALGILFAALGRRRRRWQLDNDIPHETAGLAAELADEIGGVEGPGDANFVLLVHHLLEDELTALCVCIYTRLHASVMLASQMIYIWFHYIHAYMEWTTDQLVRPDRCCWLLYI